MRLLGAGAWFCLGFAAAFVALAALDVYSLGHIEGIKGPDTTFMLFASLSPIYAFIGAACYMLGLRSERHTPHRHAVAAAGSVVALVFWMAGSASYLGFATAALVAWPLLIFGAFFAPRIQRSLEGWS
jgi:hypothetical protein